MKIYIYEKFCIWYYITICKKGKVRDMKNFKRILAILLAAALVFTLFGCAKKNSSATEDTTTTEAGTTETSTEHPNAPSDITVNFSYFI